MSEGHPRQETQHERNRAYSELRRAAELKLRKYGTISPQIFPSLRARDVNIRFQDGRLVSLLKTSGSVVGQSANRLKVTIYKENDVTGPNTCYTSADDGPFTRTDTNPQAHGVPTERELSPTEEKIESGEAHQSLSELLAGSLNMIITKLQDASEGIDGSVISAQEALDVAEAVRIATVDTSTSS